MSLNCPECGKKMSLWEVPKFTRLRSIMCSQCECFLCLDPAGRRSLWIPVIVSFLFIFLAFKTGTGQWMALIYLIVGYVIGARLADSYGSLSVDSDRTASENQNDH